MLSPDDLLAIWVTIKLATVSTVIILCLATPLAWWLARKKSVFHVFIESFFSLPILLPPTVLGFYLLMLLGPDSPIYHLVTGLGFEPLVFSFPGLVIGSVIYSFPFVMQPLQTAFRMIDQPQLEMATIMGGKPLQRFFHIILPSTRRAYLTASILGFAHVVGEFGVILMIGGSIPGKTKVLSIAIYDYVEQIDYSKAHLLSFAMLAFAYVLLVIIYSIDKKSAPN